MLLTTGIVFMCGCILFEILNIYPKYAETKITTGKTQFTIKAYN